MKITTKPATGPAVGLNALPRVVLDQRNQRLLDEAVHASGGDPAWRARKAAEARDLLALSQIAPPGRLRVVLLELRVALRALLWMRVKLPCRPKEDNVLPCADHVMLGLTYPREAIRRPLPGTAFVQILQPPGVWLASVATDGQPLCLGPQMPCGIPCKELVLMSYGALSLQTLQIDEQDPAGVLNGEAARWWQANTALIPLSHTPFLERDHDQDA
jgi:hypothetical protein